MRATSKTGLQQMKNNLVGRQNIDKQTSGSVMSDFKSPIMHTALRAMARRKESVDPGEISPNEEREGPETQEQMTKPRKSLEQGLY